MATIPKRSDELRRQTEGTEANIVVEFIAFVSERKKWWLVPVFAFLLLVGLLSALSGSALAPFIYTLF